MGPPPARVPARVCVLPSQYTESEFKALVREFQEFDVPLDVLVIDMDCTCVFMCVCERSCVRK